LSLRCAPELKSAASMSQITVSEGAKRLAAGELLAFPTETVYGLGADATSDAAVAKIFAAKGRPADHPLIVHLSDAALVQRFATHVPDFAQRLIDAFWPGPLTVILPRKEGVAAACAGGQDSIGLRCPSHPLAGALLAECTKLGVVGVAAPSANKFGKVSPTTAAHVASEFGDEIPVLDGGACEVGIESTLIDCTRGAPVLLRPGTLTKAQLEAAMGQRLLSNHEHSALISAGLEAENTLKTTVAKKEAPRAGYKEAPRASGTLASHYAPRAPLRLMDAKALQTALDLLGAEAKNIAVYARSPLKPSSSQLLIRRMPDDALATAQQLFAVLREFDAQGVALIWVETPPEGSLWEGVRDRLQRASA
jgi:L-threonylcarbamoyladenylate synthase